MSPPTSSCWRPAASRCPRPAATAPGSRSRAASVTRIVPTTPALAPLVLDADEPCPRARCPACRTGRRDRRSGSTAAVATRLARRAAVDAFRRQRSGGAERVAPLAARRARGRARFADAQHAAAARLSTASMRRWTSLAREHVRGRRCRPRSRTILPGVGRRCACSAPRIARPRRRSRISHAPIAGGWPTRCVEWPLAVTDSRGYNYAEATAGGVALDGDRSGDDGIAASARGCISSARCWTSTGGLAGSTSSGHGRARTSPPARSPPAVASAARCAARDVTVASTRSKPCPPHMLSVTRTVRRDRRGASGAMHSTPPDHLRRNASTGERLRAASRLNRQSTPRARRRAPRPGRARPGRP